ncbi:MAG: sugar ABC transporter permease [Ruminococcus sp.]|jgi:multiple sugar transport system permease protein|nr:sugar ABC transporter permease [Ruminococcus sp.]
MATLKRRKSISYTKWGYFFIAPFVITYAVCSLYPLLTTFFYAFFDYLIIFGQDPKLEFVGLGNFIKLFTANPTTGIPDMIRYTGNTFVIWIVGFAPQIFFSLVLASWFTDLRMRLKATGFFKVVIYLPNIIMAAAISMLFFIIFGDNGPINQVILATGGTVYRFYSFIWPTRFIIAGINFLMWYGNTTIMLMAAINGIDTSLYESASIDGANANQTFWRITMPLIRPILLYVFITSLIGGIQMFDIPNILSKGLGTPNFSTYTLVMFLNAQLAGNRNYGDAGVTSIFLFIVGGLLSLAVFWSMRDKDAIADAKRRKKAKGAKLL